MAWAVLQPALAVLLFSLLFGRFARMPSDGAPYPVFVLAGILPWNYFAAVLSRSTESVVGGANLVTKVYFPRVILPASAAAAAAVDLAVAALLFAALAAWHGVTPGTAVLLLPVLLAVTAMNALGFGLWFSALAVRYRDVSHALPFCIQLWMFATPVIYPASLLGARSPWLLLNPMAGVIEAARAALLGTTPVPWGALGASAAAGLAALLSGALYFRQAERRFADFV